MHISSQLSKASETSECGEDLQVSNSSDRELLRPMVSHEKLLVPWVWASRFSGNAQPASATPTSCSPTARLLNCEATTLQLWHRPATSSCA